MPKKGRYPPQLRRANEAKRDRDRDRRILLLWRDGASYTDISRLLRSEGVEIKPNRVCVIIQRELAEATEENRSLARDILSGELMRMDDLLRQAQTIIKARCRKCNGNGTISEIEGIEAMETCPMCNGDGLHHHVDIRLKAMTRAQSIIDQRAKMLRLYDGAGIIDDDDEGSIRGQIRADLSKLDEAALEEMLRDLDRGMKAVLESAPDA